MNANRRRYQLLRLGVPCSAGRSPRSPAAFPPRLGICAPVLVALASACSAGRSLRSPAALQRKKRLVFRSKEGGANAV